MKAKVLTLDAGEAGEIDLSDDIFGLEPRADLIHRVIVWQLAKRRASSQRERRLRRFGATSGGARTLAQKSTACATPSVIKAAAWRLLSAANLLRAEPAMVFAALSHMLMYGLRLVQGFFIVYL